MESEMLLNGYNQYASECHRTGKMNMSFDKWKMRYENWKKFDWMLTEIIESEDTLEIERRSAEILSHKAREKMSEFTTE
jgi:hypothetical protein